MNIITLALRLPIGLGFIAIDDAYLRRGMPVIVGARGSPDGLPGQGAKMDSEARSGACG